MPSRWLESIIGGIIGSLIGSSAVAYFIFHIQQENNLVMDHINYNILRMGDALGRFNSSAGDLMSAMNELGYSQETEDREQKFY
ncbi:hypothetical protein TWF718_003165 [Orbilia javanica]|uniref:Uncharacterized protein n=1 Tax=Orbilia javanica TaxID=47235 RepID=A0AAN8MH44_9PEZI